MAKRKKKTTHHRRRRRMGGVASHGFMNDVMEVGGLVAGSVAATVVQRHATSLNPKIVSAGEIVAGFLIKKHSKHPFMTGVGWGMVGAGGIGIAHEFGAIHGLDDMVSGMLNSGYQEELDMPGRTGGFSNNMHVNGFGNSHRVTGTDDEVMYENTIRPIGM